MDFDDADEDFYEYDEAGWELARRGIQMALNNQVEAAEALLRANASNPGEDGLQAQAGLCFLTFMNALMTFEEEKMTTALNTFRATERSCNTAATSPSVKASPSFSTLAGVKNKMQGLLGSVLSINAKEEEPSLKWERQIIAADCQVLEAVITFLQQDWGSYMKGGWVLRKAWKIYHKTYTQIWQIYVKKIGIESSGNVAPPPPPSSTAATVPTIASPSKPKVTQQPSSKSRLSHSFSMPMGFIGSVMQSKSSPPESVGSCSPNSMSSESSPASSPAMSINTLCRLMSGVSFGFGLFHLAVSLLPPKLLSLVHMFGFEGDRQIGIQALHFARQGPDMRGPIATLTLLWYHTIVRPFFGLDGSNLQSGTEAAQRLIDSTKENFANSALFLFFEGRVQRLKSNFVSALHSYELALHVSAQREVRLLCLHEVGWSHVLLMQWQKAAKAFLQLRKESRWSKAFYSYLSAVCLGACGDLVRCASLAEETPKVARKNTSNQLERFLSRRASKMLADNPSDVQSYCLILAYELLYLWNALGACMRQTHSDIRIDCERLRVVPLEGVRHLILGSIYGNSGRLEEAKVSYGKAIKQVNELDEENGNSCEPEAHASAFAAYELGLLLCRENKTRDEGRRYLEFARDNFQNYDFETRLSVRIHAALKFYSENPNERFAQQLICS